MSCVNKYTHHYFAPTIEFDLVIRKHQAVNRCVVCNHRGRSEILKNFGQKQKGVDQNHGSTQKPAW